MSTFTKRGRSYRVDGESVPSVTTIIKDGLPSPALMTWAARATAGAAVDGWDELGALPVSERLRRLERAAWESRDRAALRGTEIHGLGEALAHGRTVDVPEAYMPTVEGYARFLDAWDVAPSSTETPVCHPEHGWAGTTDLRARLRDGSDWLLDLKTGKGVYESAALQVTAYANARLAIAATGSATFDWEPPEALGVIHVTPEGSRLVRIDPSAQHGLPDLYTVFRHVLVVARFAREAKAAYRDRRPWPIGEPLQAPAA